MTETEVALLDLNDNLIRMIGNQIEWITNPKAPGYALYLQPNTIAILRKLKGV